MPSLSIHKWNITTEYYLVIIKDEILSLAVTWMDLENIIPSEVNQTEKDNYYTASLIYGI